MSETQSPSQEVLIRIQATPNPNAWKFVLDRPVLTEGKATYSTLPEAAANNLAHSLMQIPDVRQVHFFQNVITITHSFDADVESLQAEVCAVIKTRIVVHNPNISVKDEKLKMRESLPPEIQKIEGILDDTIRPGLQGDGGDIEVVKLDGKQLYISYQGACGTCPSSTQGTLMAIEGILREQYDPELEVIPL